MKHILPLCIVAWSLMSGMAMAQTSSEPTGPHFILLDEAATQAAIADRQARANQCFLLKNQAKAALAKNEIRKAEALFKQAVGCYPDDGEARVRLADIHLRARQPEAVVADLEALVNPRPNFSSSVGQDISVCMMYVLAQIDCRNWGPAAACYEKSFRSDLTWSLPGGGPEHNFPDLRFDPNNPDFFGLRVQAHLIRGAYQPEFVEEEEKPSYMLDHLRLTLKDNPRSLDATFLSGFMLAKLERFPEARVAFEKAMKLASKEARPEVQKALDALKIQEEAKRSKEASAKSHP